ncbi:hypothetical protein [Roseomonas genomospecies 6]|uniref:Uncharacterized protein n=1 Tax=Roseomonas genomospecies 6 TaxID=214106 RepID=A0A9W7KNT4_9PROT|nr:hypothetical protein [Roseomonas genomospecies 6]KAA0675823.1 hypothetical protein DS843_29790 [Roseomonas genomospecies 6]
MPTMTNWTTRHAVTRTCGCDLAVVWRGPEVWAWVVTVAGEQVRSGSARTMIGAQDAALRAAKAHADDGGRVQLPLL